MIAIEHSTPKNVLHIHVSGKLLTEDYDLFSEGVEQIIKDEGRIRVLFEMEDFHGWSAGALWQDLKFDMHHFSDIERLALVGENKWEKGLAVLCKPFTRAKVRYFDRSDRTQAAAWVDEV